MPFKNSAKKFKTFIVLFSSFLLLLGLGFTKIKAQEEGQPQFYIDARVEYRASENGTTTVTHNITLENAFSNLYATSYSLSLNNIEPINPRAFQGNNPLPLSVTQTQEGTRLKVDFEEAVAGKGEQRNFRIVFEETSFSVRTGEVWEISIPRLSSESSFRSYNVELLVPKVFGEEAFLSPQPLEKNETGNNFYYRFGKEQVSNSGISAGFGQFQVFSFKLNYHLENPLNRTATTEIAIPPDTAFQKVYFEVLDPKPNDVYEDPDGNWLAVYELKPRERIDVVASGSVQIFSDPRSYKAPDREVLEKNLQSTEYWQTDSPRIRELAETLQTPEAIYNYVTSTLTYDYDRVRPNVDRLGAAAALENPSTAICMEYTDLFIAIARAAGIPAREINGYAYTENPEIQPLSLVADVLHAWPEYWDEERGVWVPVDPTWGSTTGGIDFFNKLDLRHFTFVIHGQEDKRPYPPGSYKLGPNPQKDVFVNFGQLPANRTSTPQVLIEKGSSIPFLNSTYKITLENSGPSALYELTPEVYFDDTKKETFHVERLLPYSSEVFEVKIPFSFLGKDTPDNISVLVAGESVEAPTEKRLVILYNLIALFILFITIVAVSFYKLRRQLFVNLLNKAKGLLRFNENEKTNENSSSEKGS